LRLTVSAGSGAATEDAESRIYTHEPAARFRTVIPLDANFARIVASYDRVPLYLDSLALEVLIIGTPEIRNAAA
jgi:hypothetical protein